MIQIFFFFVPFGSHLGDSSVRDQCRGRENKQQEIGLGSSLVNKKHHVFFFFFSFF